MTKYNLLQENDAKKVLKYLQISSHDFKKPKTNNKVYCQQKSTRNIFGFNGSQIDSGASTCGWVVDKIYYQCYNGGLSTLSFGIKNQIFKNEEKKILKNENKMYKQVSIGYDNYIEKIYIKYLLRGSKKIISNLTFQINNKKFVKINCGRYNYTQTLRFNSKERINGFRFQIKYHQIQSLSFYYHRVQSTNNQFGYSEAIRSSLFQRNVEKDVLEQKGPYGLEKGNYFIDPDRYSDWHIKQIMIQSDDYIRAIQIQLENIIFNYKVITNIHGKFQANLKVNNVIIPKDKKLTKISFYLDNQGYLQGLQFMINNSMQTKLFGKQTIIKKQLSLTSSEIPIGFYGYEINNKIGSLGIIISQQRGDSMSVFV